MYFGEDNDIAIAAGKSKCALAEPVATSENVVVVVVS